MLEPSSRIFLLQQRQKAISAIREYLYKENFLEVETPILLKSTCPDSYIDSVLVGEKYLATSTEYQIKRLIAEGFEKVFTLTKNFRENDRGRFHSSEFTMLEWARANQCLRMVEADAINFIRKAFQLLYPDQESLRFNGHQINFMGIDWEQLTVREAFKIHLGIDDLGNFSLESLLEASQSVGIEFPLHFQQDQSLVISYLLDQLQSHLGKKTPTFLNEWPAFLTSSAPINTNDPYVVDRSELYIGGVEIANGFPFLTNESVQRKLFQEELNKRKELGKPSVRIDEKYLKALSQGLPEGAGMALGIDRLIMVLTSSSRLSEVQAFDWDEL